MICSVHGPASTVRTIYKRHLKELKYYLQGQENRNRAAINTNQAVAVAQLAEFA